MDAGGPAASPSSPTNFLDPPTQAQKPDTKPKPPRKQIEGFGSIVLRGTIWHLDYYQNGKQHRESSHSTKEREAIALLKQRHGEMARGEFISPKKDKLLVSELLDAVTQDYKLVGNRSIRALRFRLVPLKEAFGHLKAVNVTEPMIEKYKADRRAMGRAKATVNRELAVLRRAFKLAVEQKQISPNRVPRVRQFTEDNARQGFVDYEEFSALVQHLPPPVDDVCWFAYLSGWRKGEVLSLTWADVDQTRGVVTLRPEFSKNKEKRELPLVDQTLQAVIARRWNARLVMTTDGPKVCDSLFHRDGRPVRAVRRKWVKACIKVGRARPLLDAAGRVVLHRTGRSKGRPVMVPTLLFHDLRRSAVRNLVNAGTPERVAMRITGHKTRAVFDRYMIVDDRDVRAALARTEAVRAESQALAQHKTGIFQHSESRTQS